jgi:hypothetical protein
MYWTSQFVNISEDPFKVEKWYTKLLKKKDFDLDKMKIRRGWG